MDDKTTKTILNQIRKSISSIEEIYTANRKESVDNKVNNTNCVNSNKKHHRFSTTIDRQAKNIINNNFYTENCVNTRYGSIETNIFMPLINPLISINKEKKPSTKNFFDCYSIYSFKGTNTNADKESECYEGEKILNTIYADFLENKSNEELSLSYTKEEEMDNSNRSFEKFKKYLENHEIVSYVYEKGFIKGFSALSYPNNKEISSDKISININNKKNNYDLNFFGLYSGINDDSQSSDFLRQNLDKNILKEDNIEEKTLIAIKNGYLKTEKEFICNFLSKICDFDLKNRQQDISNILPQTSSMALININERFYMSNLGNNISIISSKYSSSINCLSIEHKTKIEPGDKNNYQIRIFPGPKFYEAIADLNYFSDNILNKAYINNRKRISSVPDIVSIKYKNDIDFIFMCCKNITLKMTKNEICQCVYETMKMCIKKHSNYEKFLSCVPKNIIKKCIAKNITGNLSCIFICFDTIKQLFEEANEKNINKVLVSMSLLSPTKNDSVLYNDIVDCDLVSNNIFSCSNLLEVKANFNNTIYKTSSSKSKLSSFEKQQKKSNTVFTDKSMEEVRNTNEISTDDHNHKKNIKKKCLKNPLSKKEKHKTPNKKNYFKKIFCCLE